MPNIKRSVSARTCREMAVECIEICKGLAPYMYEAFRISKEDMEARKILEALIKTLIGTMIESNGSRSVGGASEKTEETGDGTMDSVFDHNDLDSGMENKNTSDNSSKGESKTDFNKGADGKYLFNSAFGDKLPFSGHIPQHNTHSSAAEVKRNFIFPDIGLFELPKFFTFSPVDDSHIHQVFQSCLKIAVQERMPQHTFVFTA